MHEELMFLLGSILLAIDLFVNLCQEGIGSTQCFMINSKVSLLTFHSPVSR